VLPGFLLGKGGQDKEAYNFMCNGIGLGNSEWRFYQLGFEDGSTGLSVESTGGGELEIYNALGSGIITPDDGT
jgi:hypothetical protein